MHACQAAEDCRNSSVGTEHLLIGILKDHKAKLTQLLNQYGITEQKIQQEVKILFGFESSECFCAIYTSTVKAVLKDAELMADRKKKQEVSMDELSISLLKKENNVALELLRRSGIAVSELIDELNQEDLFYECQELRNLNQTAGLRKGKTALREKELEAIIHTLLKMEKSNCVLTGPAGVGKTAVVEELAARIEKNQVPEELRGCIIAELNVNQMVAGTKYRGEFEAKIQNLLTALKKYPHVILFIDELHLIVGAGKAEGSLDIASVLKPVLSRKGTRVIGATTNEEYERWIEKDKALQRRFVRIDICETDEQMTVSMLKEKAKDLQEYHHLKFQKGLLKQCVSVSAHLFPHLKFPDKAIDLLDMSCSMTKCRSLDTVTSEVMKEAASHLTQLPVSIEGTVSQIEADLKEELSACSLEKLKDGIEYALSRHCLSLVSFSESEEVVMKVLNQFVKRINAQVKQVHASVFSFCSFQDWLKGLYEDMNPSCFQIVVLKEMEKLPSGYASLLNQEVLQQLMDMLQIHSFACGLFLLCGLKENSCGFKMET